MSNKQFDLEQQIMGCWNIVEDLNTLYSSVMEDGSLTKDKIANILLGLADLYQIKFDKTFSTFEELIALRSEKCRGNQTNPQRSWKA